MNRFLLACLVALSSSALADPPPASGAGFVFPDVVKLRKELLDRPDFDGFGMEHAEREAVDSAHAAWKEGNGDKSLDILHDFLKKYPCSIVGWRNMAEASEAWANVAKVPEHKRMFANGARLERGIQANLMRSMLESADGKSETTAYRVLEISEEYELIAWLHLKPENQALLHAPTGHSYDMLKLRDEAGSEVTVYFDVTNFWNAENRRFAEPAKQLPGQPSPAASNAPDKATSG